VSTLNSIKLEASAR